MHSTIGELGWSCERVDHVGRRSAGHWNDMVNVPSNAKVTHLTMHDT